MGEKHRPVHVAILDHTAQLGGVELAVVRLMQERAYLYSGIAVPWVNVARKEVQGLTHSFSQPVVKSAWLAA